MVGGEVFRFAQVLGCPYPVGKGQPIDPADPARGWLSRYQDKPADEIPTKVRLVGFDHKLSTYVYRVP